MGESKVVQTEVPVKVYRSFKKVAEGKHLSLREALRNAIERWTEEEHEWSADPVFTSKPVTGKIKTGAEDLDKMIYGEG